MNRAMKKITVFFLSFSVIFCSLLPSYAEEIIKRGMCGESISYTLDKSGVLTLSGQGRTDSWKEGDSPFYNNPDIKTVKIVGNIESLGSSMFSSCTGISEVFLSESIKNIENYAFYKCSSLKAVNIPLSTENIGKYAFSMCEKLENIYFSDAVISIGEQAFAGDKVLKCICFGTELEKIGKNAFSGCTGIEKIYVKDRVVFSAVSFSAGNEAVRRADKTFEIKQGDIDMDGCFTSAEARLVLRYSVKLEKIINTVCADFDGDRKITAADARGILRASVGLIKCRFHKYTEKEVISADGKKEKHRVCSYCGRDTDAVPEEQSELSEEIKDIFRSYGAVSASVGMLEDGELESTVSYGYADMDAGRLLDSGTKLRAASTSKLVFCIVFMAMKDAGLVDDMTDISEYFGYKCRSPYYPDEVITPSMIMTHSAGIIGDYTNEETYYLPDYALQKPELYLKIKPGSEYKYSNAGISVLSCMMEKITGKYLSELAHEYVFDKMGIDAAFDADHLKEPGKIGNIYYELSAEDIRNKKPKAPGHSLHLAQGNLLISAKDYARILAMLINDGRAEDGTVILTPARVEEMEKIRIFEDYAKAPGHYGVGYGIQVEDTVIPGRKVFTHIGSAYGMYCAYVYDPADRTGIYVMTTGCPYDLEPQSEIYNVCLDVIRAYYRYMDK